MSEVGEYVAALLAGQPPNVLRHVTRQADIAVIREFRVICPQCGALPDSPYPSALDARTAQRNHFRDHRDERI